jgi:hypothetical protein
MVHSKLRLKKCLRSHFTISISRDPLNLKDSFPGSWPGRRPGRHKVDGFKFSNNKRNKISQCGSEILISDSQSIVPRYAGNQSLREPDRDVTAAACAVRRRRGNWRETSPECCRCRCFRCRAVILPCGSLAGAARAATARPHGRLAPPQPLRREAEPRHRPCTGRTAAARPSRLMLCGRAAALLCCRAAMLPCGRAAVLLCGRAAVRPCGRVATRVAQIKLKLGIHCYGTKGGSSGGGPAAAAAVEPRLHLNQFHSRQIPPDSISQSPSASSSPRATATAEVSSSDSSCSSSRAAPSRSSKKNIVSSLTMQVFHCCSAVQAAVSESCSIATGCMHKSFSRVSCTAIQERPKRYFGSRLVLIQIRKDFFFPSADSMSAEKCRVPKPARFCK